MEIFWEENINTSIDIFYPSLTSTGFLIYSPVKLVKYEVQNTRVGQMTDYDKLLLEITTDGRITPDDALKQSAAILRHHLDVFDQISEEQIEQDTTKGAE